MICHQGLSDFVKVVDSDICSGIYGGRLELFESSVVKYLSDRSLEGSSGYIRAHYWTIV
jgi:hypothetical protein